MTCDDLRENPRDNAEKIWGEFEIFQVFSKLIKRRWTKFNEESSVSYSYVMIDLTVDEFFSIGRRKIKLNKNDIQWRQERICISLSVKNLGKIHFSYIYTPSLIFLIDLGKYKDCRMNFNI